MDETDTDKELERQATPPKAGEPASTQNPPEDNMSRFQHLSTGSSTEQDKQPTIASNCQDKDSSSSRASLAVAAVETSQETSRFGGEEDNAQRLHRRDDSPLSLHRPPEPSSPPDYPQNPTRSLAGDMITPQAVLDPRAIGYSGVPPQQPLISDSRSHALGQLTAAAELQLSPGSLKASGNRRRKRSFQDDEEDEEDTEWYEKKKKSRGSKGKQAERWDHMFQRLVNFKNLHGHCLVPNRYPEDPSLGAWVSTQRRHYKILMSGDPNMTTPMTPERASRLLSIGFKWATKDPRHVPWEIRFQELLAYKEKYGDCVVPIGFKENPRLSNWVSQQRQEYKLLQQGKKARISLEKINALNAVGFVWEAQRGSNRNRKKRKQSQHSSADLEALLANVASSSHSAAAAHPPSHSAEQRFDIPPPNELRQDIPPAILAQVLSLLGANQQSDVLQAAEKGTSTAAAASRMVPDVARRAPPPHGGGALPNLPMASLAHPAASSRQHIGGQAFKHAWDRQVQDHRNNLMALNAATMQNRQDQIITKHLIDALRQDSNVNSTGIGAAVQRIHGIIGHQGHAAESSRHITQNERLHRALRMPECLPPPLRVQPGGLSAARQREARIASDRSESESETSRFGVALQLGEFVKEGEQETAKPPPAMRNLGRGFQVGGASVGFGAPRAVSLPTGFESYMQPARLVTDSHSHVGRNAVNTTRGTSAPFALGSNPNRAAKQPSSSGSAQNDDDDDDDDGIFSDAEEDETAVAFLDSAMARRSSHS